MRTERSRSKLLLLLLAPLLLDGEARADARPTTALLRVHASYQGGGHGLTFWEQDFFAARNRATSAVLTQNNQTAPIQLGWVTTHFAGQASAATLQTLSAAFAANRIGVQQGRCSVAETIGPITGAFEITWYGSGARRSAFTVEFNGAEPPPPCADEVVNLYRAIQAFAAAAGAPGLGPALR